MSFDEDHALETYKSLITISVEALKALILINGGSVVALLAYLGQAKGDPNVALRMHTPVAWYIGGLVACGCAFVASYFTQLTLFNEMVRPSNKPTVRHEYLILTTAAFSAISLVAFSFGSFSAVKALSP